MIKFIKKIFLNDYVYCFIFVAVLLWLIATVATKVMSSLTDPFAEAIKDFEVTDLAFTALRVDKTEEIDTTSFFGRISRKFHIKSPEADTNVIIVNTARMGNAELAAMINNINQYQPGAIGINEVLRLSGDPFADSLLRASLKNVKNLVYAVKHKDFDPESNEHKRMETSDSLFMVFMEDSLSVRFAEVGFENMFTHDKDFKTTRHFYTRSKVNGVHHNFFAIELAEVVAPDKVNAFMKRANDYEIINYLGNLDKFYSLDADQVLNSQFDPSLIKGKIIIMGYLGESLAQENFWDDYKYYTPMNKKYAGKTFPDMFETVIYANITSQILNDRHINVLSPNMNLLINFIIIFLNVIIFSILFHSATVWWDLFSILISLVEMIILMISTALIFGLLNIEIDLNPSIVFVLVLGTFLELYYGLFKVFIQKLSVKYLIIQEAKKRDKLKEMLSGTTKNLINDAFNDIDKNIAKEKGAGFDIGNIKDLDKE